MFLTVVWTQVCHLQQRLMGVVVDGAAVMDGGGVCLSGGPLFVLDTSLFITAPPLALPSASRLPLQPLPIQGAGPCRVTACRFKQEVQEEEAAAAGHAQEEVGPGPAAPAGARCVLM